MSACVHMLVWSYKCCLVWSYKCCFVYTRLSVSLHTCLHVTCAQDTVSVCSCKCLPICKTACLHMYLLDCTCVWLCTHMSACFTCDDYILHQLSGCFFQVAVCLPKCLIVSSDCLFIQMFASSQVCSWFVLLNDAWSKYGHPVAYTTSTLTSKVLDGLTTFLFSV